MEEGTKVWLRNKGFEFLDVDSSDEDEEEQGMDVLWLPSKIKSKRSHNESKETVVVTVVYDTEDNGGVGHPFAPVRYT